jgi:hypothetical protein
VVEIPADVLSQIEEIRRMGVADPTDSYVMTRLAFEMDLAAAFFWITKHRMEYEKWANSLLTS